MDIYRGALFDWRNNRPTSLSGATNSGQLSQGSPMIPRWLKMPPRRLKMTPRRLNMAQDGSTCFPDGSRWLNAHKHQDDDDDDDDDDKALNKSNGFCVKSGSKRSRVPQQMERIALKTVLSFLTEIHRKAQTQYQSQSCPRRRRRR